MGLGLIFFVHYKVLCWLVLCVFWCKSLKKIVNFLSHKGSSNQFLLKCGLCPYFAIITIVPLIRAHDLARENRRFSVQRLRRAWQPNVNYTVSRQTVNWRLVARAYRARRMVKVPTLTETAKRVRRHWAQKHINQPLGQWQHVIFCDGSRFMLFRIDNRIRVRRLVGEAMNKDLHMVIWLTEAVLYMYGVVSLIWEKPPCAFWIRCHWSRLSPSFYVKYM